MELTNYHILVLCIITITSKVAFTLLCVRMASLQNAADLMASADDQMALITEKLDQILRESVDISSFTLAAPRLVSDLKVHLCFFSDS